MLLPVEWLKDFIEINESPEEISDMLTMIGLEVEGGETSDGTTVFEVNITPNRPDCLSVIGIARELRAATGRALKFPDYHVEDEFEGDFQVIIDSPLCNRYTGRIIKGIRTGESPDRVKKRLELSGIRPVNNIVDITNYVLMELGHPLHAFDLDKLRGKTIRVDTAGKPLQFKTLDNTERTIPQDGLLIRDAERPVAIAGIMGGLETEVSGETSNIFLESAYFKPASIRRTSRLLGLKTEASYRFERGTDIEGLSVALDRAAHLIKTLCGGVVSKKIDLYPAKLEKEKIRLRYNRINRILGIDVPRQDVLNIIELLGFSVISTSESEIMLTVPSYRVDIQDETDLIEEIGRHYGYEKIPEQIPLAPVGPLSPDSLVKRTEQKSGINKIKELVRTSGFNETINFSFMNPLLLDMLNIAETDERRKTVTLINPLRKENPSLRTFLLPSLVENLIHNLNQGIRDIKLFEVSRVFIDEGGELPHEKPVLGAIYFYRHGQKLWEDKVEVYYILKGIIEKIFQANLISPYTFSVTTEPFLHPGKSADIHAGDVRVGYVGCLSPEIKKVLDLKNIKSEIGVFELDLASIAVQTGRKTTYTALPRFPYVQRDISLLVDSTIASEEILALIRSFPSELIEDIWVFDLYQGKNIPAEKRSLGFTIQCRAKDRTLTDEEVDYLHQEITTYLIKKTGGQLRSL
ncbi:Phenylalanyl-tRNA synthetase beta chain [hydrothermal vent metagenome]|uniref:phenylalanine--tRNA ligase n=1 Tax=hydrothermal vent metagenome TaxID=652676 RepID=A0A3B1D5U3_9ZZZZ